MLNWEARLVNRWIEENIFNQSDVDSSDIFLHQFFPSGSRAFDPASLSQFAVKMRLLNVNTFAFEEFYDETTLPKYAILSHTWEEEEVSYKEIRKTPELARKKKGFAKIEGCAAIAKESALNYIWVDTCCINKSSSAELSEAINSMYRWYQDSECCYAFLSDVPTSLARGWHEVKTALMSSRWFTRGWTLQEMIAPRSLGFYNQDWIFIGAREAFANVINDHTQVPLDVLVGVTGPQDYCVAQRMAWASKRMTTRKEDMAYCLLGLFDINMPMLYGEGDKAFIRLQEEIIKKTDDMSIFAWVDESANHSKYSGLLARSPALFSKGNAVEWNRISTSMGHEITNRGIKLSLQLVPRDLKLGRGENPVEWLAVLDGVTITEPRRAVYKGICVRRVGEGDQFVRVDFADTHTLQQKELPPANTARSIAFFRQRIERYDRTDNHDRTRCVRLREMLHTGSCSLALLDVNHGGFWDGNPKIPSAHASAQTEACAFPPKATFLIEASDLPPNIDPIRFTIDVDLSRDARDKRAFFEVKAAQASTMITPKNMYSKSGTLEMIILEARRTNVCVFASRQFDHRLSEPVLDFRIRVATV